MEFKDLEFKELCSYGQEWEEGRHPWRILYEGSINIDNKDYFFILERFIIPVSDCTRKYNAFITYNDNTKVTSTTDSKEELKEWKEELLHKYVEYSNNEETRKAREALDIPDSTASDLTTTRIHFPDIYTNKDNIEINSAICTALSEEKQRQIYFNRDSALRKLIAQNIDAKKRMIEYSKNNGIEFTEEQIKLALKYEEMVIKCILYGKYNWNDYEKFINLLPEVVLRQKIFVNRNISLNSIIRTNLKYVFGNKHSGGDCYNITYKEFTNTPKNYMKYSHFSNKMNSIYYRPHEDCAKLDACKILTKEELIKIHPECSGKNPYYVDTGTDMGIHSYYGVDYNEDGTFRFDVNDIIKVNIFKDYDNEER